MFGQVFRTLFAGFAVKCFVPFLAVTSMVPVASAAAFELSAPDDLVQSGFLKYLLPRFSLKTGIRIEVVGPNKDVPVSINADGEGTPVFTGIDETWSLVVSENAPDTSVNRFVDWLTGEVGRRTIDSFKGAEGVTFAAAEPQVEDVVDAGLEGDVVEGERLSVVLCGRCHMVNEATRLTTIGSSPSFAVMRNFVDWQARFEAFFALRPHPSFTIIEDVTEPFDETRPPPIAPLEMTLEQLDEILAFVSRIPPSDLGQPIQYK